MILQKEDIKDLERRYRATFINSLAGFKQVVLIGTKSAAGISNVAIFNSIIHIGADPALYGFICRPDSVKRDTLKNILETNEYTFNYITQSYYQKAHQTSARYDIGVSEFDEVGFTEHYSDPIKAPFIKEAVVKMALKFEEKIDIKINGTMIIVGSIQLLELDKDLVGSDGFVSLEKSDVLACSGLDAYYSTKLIDRLPYAKPGKELQKIT